MVTLLILAISQVNSGLPLSSQHIERKDFSQPLLVTSTRIALSRAQPRSETKESRCARRGMRAHNWSTNITHEPGSIRLKKGIQSEEENERERKRGDASRRRTKRLTLRAFAR